MTAARKRQNAKPGRLLARTVIGTFSHRPSPRAEREHDACFGARATNLAEAAWRRDGVEEKR